MPRPKLKVKITTYKQDVVNALANAIMAFGKGDIDRTRYHIDQARLNLEYWLIDRPEKKLAEGKTLIEVFAEEDSVAGDSKERICNTTKPE